MIQYDSFVYIWKNKITGKQYIGSHKGTVDDGYISTSKYFNEDYNKNPKNFHRMIISLCESYDVARKQEADLCVKLNVKSDPMYYNRHNGDGNFINKGLTASARAKISKARSGSRLSEETKQKISASGKKLNRKISEEHRIIISQTHKRKVVSTETREKMRQNNLGKKLTEEHKAKIRKSCQGINKGIPKSDECKLKLSKIAKARTGDKNPFFGKKHSQETKDKISKANKKEISKFY